MENQTSRWSVPLLTRHRAALLALTAAAFGCSLYYLHDQLWPSVHAPKQKLHRSNARRQRRRPSSIHPSETNHVSAEHARYPLDEPWASVPIDLAFLRALEANEEVLATHRYVSTTGLSMDIPLSRNELPPVSAISQVVTREEAELVRQELELSFLYFYFWRHMPPSPIANEQQDILRSELQRDGNFSDRSIAVAIMSHQRRTLTQEIEQWERVQQQRGLEARNRRSSRQPQGITLGQPVNIGGTREDHETVMDDHSEHSWRGENEIDDGRGIGSAGRSLINLVYRIAEEQSRKDGYVHRRVTCNSCNTMPIQGIRYHCTNCLDYDLCEQCEAMQIHPKTHIFYKIRIPAPFIRNPRPPEPTWYPGKPTTANRSLEKDIKTSICRDTGYQAAEVDALWEQYRCLAATDWPGDPEGYCLAIDRETFNKCFVPQTSLRPSPPNLLYDRIFSFYDTDGNNLIGFKEFIHGLASLTKKNPDERMRRLFRGYDINNDGFVDRKDFLRMFRAYYSLTRELTRDVVSAMEDDVFENGARDTILGSQPISSVFSRGIPQGEESRAPEGKEQDIYGDYTVRDNLKAVDDRVHDTDPDELLADAAEAACFGDVGERSCIEDCSLLYSETWPPEGILDADIEKVFSPAIPATEVTLDEDQQAIRRAAHARVARDCQMRSYIRRKALLDRKVKRAFYLDSVKDLGTNNTSEPHKHDLGLVAQNELRLARNVQFMVDAGQSEMFYALLRGEIEKLDWPVQESYIRLAKELGELIYLGCTESEIAEDLSGYTMDLEESRDFVSSLSNVLETMVRDLGLEAATEDEIPAGKPLDTFPSSRRSRSSSKVRFRDEVGTEDGQEGRSRTTSMSSRSIPVNERWGSHDVPEPEKDVGRDVLYQITQEAFNELLDPVFSLREDLALATLQTRRMREKYRAEIIAAADEPFDIKQELDTYQRWWRTEPPLKELKIRSNAVFGSDEAAMFVAFFMQRAAGVKNSLTCEKCPRCARKDEEWWIGVGEYCTHCGLASRIARERHEELSPIKEPCRLCAAEGEEIYMRHDHRSCAQGHENPTWSRENARLRGIISGGYKQRDTQTVALNEEGDNNSHTDQDLRSTPAPETAINLDSSVRIFDQADPRSFEEDIAGKPLDELLAVSGYAQAATTSSLPPPPDPTLPHNRPSRVLSPEIAVPTKEHSDNIQLPDPTLPHNRPSRVLPPEVAVPENEHSDDIQSPDPTLPQNRPNSSLGEHTENSDAYSSPFLSPPKTPNSDDPSFPDPTLPQNRPNTANDLDHAPPLQTDPPATAAPTAKQWRKIPEKQPDRNLLRYWAALDMIEAEDKDRGGAGRLDFKEWDQVMKGAKGRALAFLGTWIETARF